MGNFRKNRQILGKIKTSENDLKIINFKGQLEIFCGIRTCSIKHCDLRPNLINNNPILDGQISTIID